MANESKILTAINEYINYLITLRYNYFGTTIELFDFLCYGAWNDYHSGFNFYIGQSRQQPKRDGALKDVGYHISKTDSMIEQYASDAAKKYRNAVLPKGVDSIEIKIKRSTNDSQATQTADASLERKCESIFRWYINNRFPNFLELMKLVISDYINYGNCAVEYNSIDTPYLKHKPFQQCFYGNNDPEDYGFLFSELVNERYAERLSNPLYKSIEEVSTDEKNDVKKHTKIQHLYISGTLYQSLLALENNEADALKIKPGSYYHIIYQESPRKILDVIALKDKKTIYKASNDINHTYGYTGYFGNYQNAGNVANAGYSTNIGNLCFPYNLNMRIYGRGAGIKSLGSVVQANVALRQKNNASLLSVHPAVAVPKGTEINTGSGCLDISPGRVNRINLPSAVGRETGASNLQILSNAHDVLSTFTEIYQTHISQMQAAFNVEIFSLLNEKGRTPTATEVSVRSQEAAQAFRGETSAFYSELLVPLLTDMLKDLMINPSLGSPYLTKDDIEQLMQLAQRKHMIKIFSFEDERLKAAKKAELQGDLATIVQLGQLIQNGVEIPDFEGNLQSVIKEYFDLIND